MRSAKPARRLASLPWDAVVSPASKRVRISSSKALIRATTRPMHLNSRVWRVPKALRGSRAIMLTGGPRHHGRVGTVPCDCTPCKDANGKVGNSPGDRLRRILNSVGSYVPGGKYLMVVPGRGGPQRRPDHDGRRSQQRDRQDQNAVAFWNCPTILLPRRAANHRAGPSTFGQNIGLPLLRRRHPGATERMPAISARPSLYGLSLQNCT